MSAAISVRKRLIAIVAMPNPNAALLNIAGPIDVFTRASVIIKEISGKTQTPYEVVLVSPHLSKKIITSFAGITISASENYKTIKGKIDTLLVTGYSPEAYKPSKAFLQWLQRSSIRVRRMGSICRGAFVLAEAGLLDNRRVSTHWKYCDELQKCFPALKVDTDPIFVKDGSIYTSGGVSSGIDLALALVEEDYGSEIALNVARQLVLFLRRPGNQSQFSAMLTKQETDHEPIRNLQQWIAGHLNEELNVEQLADKCAMSPRNFARVFLRETGFTPAKYIEKLRLETARRRLTETHLSLEQIASQCGLGSADAMRRVFLRHLKVSPSHYRSSFKTTVGQRKSI